MAKSISQVIPFKRMQRVIPKICEFAPNFKTNIFASRFKVHLLGKQLGKILSFTNALLLVIKLKEVQNDHSFSAEMQIFSGLMQLQQQISEFHRSLSNEIPNIVLDKRGGFLKIISGAKQDVSVAVNVVNETTKLALLLIKINKELKILFAQLCFLENIKNGGR